MSEPYYIEKGPVIIVPDPINPDFYQVKKNPEWSQIPEICSFSDFICWNYQEDYERVMRHCIENGLVPYITLSITIPAMRGILKWHLSPHNLPQKFLVKFWITMVCL